MSQTKSYSLPKNFLHRCKDYALPLAIIIGAIAYRWIAPLVVTVPYLIMAMLFFTYLKLRIRDMKLHYFHFLLAGVQLLLSIASFFLLRKVLPLSVAQGAFSCFICPAASASPVVIGLLGGNIAMGTAYVLLTSVGISFVAPILFTMVGSSNVPFWTSAGTIFAHILPIILIPLIVAQLIRIKLPKIQVRLVQLSTFAFWIWVFALAVIIAKTVEYMTASDREQVPTMIWLAVVGLLACLIQFGIGKWFSRRFLGEDKTFAQSMGQKNSSLAIWMAQMYLDPLSSVAMAAYSIWQNIINSWQLMQVSKEHRRQEQAKTEKQ